MSGLYVTSPKFHSFVVHRKQNTFRAVARWDIVWHSGLINERRNLKSYDSGPFVSTLSFSVCIMDDLKCLGDSSYKHWAFIFINVVQIGVR